MTPVKMDTSCFRKRTTLVVKVRNSFELNFEGLLFNVSMKLCSFQASADDVCSL